MGQASIYHAFRPACNHPTCRACLTEYVKTKTNDGEVNDKDLICPHHDCKAKLRTDDILDLLQHEPETLTKFLDFKAQHFKPEGRDAFECIMFQCPTPNCAWSMVPSDAMKVQCLGCKKYWCPQCSGEPHLPYTCQEAPDERVKQCLRDIGGHQCPACGMGIEKKGGCQFMRCKLCNHTYCNVCGASVTPAEEHAHLKFGLFANACVNVPKTG
ncbi:unnamed protein product [Vitrella brassicaformis CCMP3155]|uniref:RING-type domain-containing protein n=1 Tax=Vitrella brassicaformis (strain CCMP3155) TaxID=1169540 RepID=A0A0G4G839_VITBC|nr:unnamed protein product [Vitrella brassicaformis CCMP3155]|eukprot:CEM24678.1 unnamed protein product [Vitrella brassicaformis CCMP3155]